MDHDMLMFNKQGREIDSLRFSMWDRTSDMVYKVFDVESFNGFVSGKGEQRTFTLADLKTANNLFIKKYKQTIKYPDHKTTSWRITDIERFLSTGESTGKVDGEVTIYFG